MTAQTGSTLVVLAVGPLALLQDEGRVGLAELGVGRSGASDRRSSRLANRLLANAGDEAVIEVLLGGLTVRAEGTCTVLLSGASVDARLDDRPVGPHAPLTMRDGQVLRLGAVRGGLRTYVGVRGGIDVPPVLGSRSHDSLAGLGPPPLAPGSRLLVGRPGWALPSLDVAPVPAVEVDDIVLRARRGPRDAWFADPDVLVRNAWTVSDHTDRIGVRLDGPGRLSRTDPGRELPSEAMVRGAVQVPPDGRPVVLGADHPLTGGYPVVAVITDDDSDRLAQLPPGATVRFRWAS